MTEDRGSKAVRYGIVGAAAAIADAHLEALAGVPSEIVGMADVDAERGAEKAAKAGCPFFFDYREMLRAVRPEAVVICTPHPLHASQAQHSLLAGAHVLVEKPMAVEVAEADAMIEAAEHARRVLAVNFQERFRPAVRHARDFIARGELGPLVRVLAVEPRLRTAAYYRSSAWRGTWKGEGGGVLVNQAPHALDILCHLAGMPRRAWGMTRTRGHAIEAEDSAQAMLEYPNGAFGYVATSTVEGGMERRLEIIGDRASLVFVEGELTVVRFDPPLGDHIAGSPDPFRQPIARAEAVPFPPTSRSRHHDAHRSFHEAIRGRGAPWCDGRSALMSLELANAIALSSFTERPVDLPLDRAAYGQLLADLRARAR
jgi:predicted dehydrogenase